jgi:hypothetical protein
VTSTAWLWARYDLCAAINREVNADSRAQGRDADATALAKVERLIDAGLAGAEVDVDQVEGRPAVLVKDCIARWVLRDDADLPEYFNPKSHLSK